MTSPYNTNERQKKLNKCPSFRGKSLALLTLLPACCMLNFLLQFLKQHIACLFYSSYTLSDSPLPDVNHPQIRPMVGRVFFPMCHSHIDTLGASAGKAITGTTGASPCPVCHDWVCHFHLGMSRDSADKATIAAVKASLPTVHVVYHVTHLLPWLRNM